MAKQLKTFIKTRLPFLVPLWNQHVKIYSLIKHSVLTKYISLKNNISLTRKSPKQVFTAIFRGNKWGDLNSLSGPGSNLIQTEAVRRVLPLLFQELKIKSLLDVPCGDFYWMRLVEMDVEYIGGDIVDELIIANQNKYSSLGRRFIHVDLLRDELPNVDLILCRDCLVHFSYRHILIAIKNIKNSRSTYLLTTTFIGRKRNEDIPTGAWQPINLQLPPFSFPMPLKLIDEECPIDKYRDKHLGLWKTDDIPEF
jgi:hypothetical protein